MRGVSKPACAVGWLISKIKGSGRWGFWESFLTAKSGFNKKVWGAFCSTGPRVQPSSAKASR